MTAGVQSGAGPRARANRAERAGASFQARDPRQPPPGRKATPAFLSECGFAALRVGGPPALPPTASRLDQAAQTTRPRPTDPEADCVRTAPPNRTPASASTPTRDRARRDVHLARHAPARKPGDRA